MTRAKESAKARAKESASKMGKERVLGKVESRKVPRYLQELWQDRTQVERMLGERP